MAPYPTALLEGDVVSRQPTEKEQHSARSGRPYLKEPLAGLNLRRYSEYCSPGAAVAATLFNWRRASRLKRRRHHMATSLGTAQRRARQAAAMAVCLPRECCAVLALRSMWQMGGFALAWLRRGSVDRRGREVWSARGACVVSRQRGGAEMDGVGGGGGGVLLGCWRYHAAPKVRTSINAAVAGGNIITDRGR